MKNSSKKALRTELSFECFSSATIEQLERALASANSREEAIFFRTLINLKLQLAQERIVGETLL